jgi:hypothetical protein
MDNHLLTAVLEKAKRALAEELNYLSQDDVQYLKLFFTSRHVSLRPYMLNTAYVRDSLWPSLRNEEEIVLHFLFSTMMTFRQLVEIDEEEGFELLTNAVKSSYRGIASSDVVDEDFFAHLSRSRDIEPLLQQNGWLVWLLFLLSHTRLLGITGWGVISGKPTKGA